MSEKNVMVISILTYYAKQIFDGTKKFEFRKSPLKDCDLNKPIYVYSAKEDKAIIGSFEVNKIHKGSLNEILKVTGYDARSDRNEIEDYFRCCGTCYALSLGKVKKFDRPIPLYQLKRLDPEVRLPQYYSYYPENSAVYQFIMNRNNQFGGNGFNKRPQPQRHF